MNFRLPAALWRAPAFSRSELFRALAVQAVVSAVIMLAAFSCAKAETCTASHYGHGDGLNGSRTASGERFNTNAMTAAHKTRSFGSHVTVTSLATHRSVVVRVTDRGPFVRGRCIDLSYAAARALGMGGTARVEVR